MSVLVQDWSPALHNPQGSLVAPKVISVLTQRDQFCNNILWFCH